MTVKSLIELLQALPQDLPVYLADWNEGYASVIPIDYVNANREDDGMQFLPRVAEACARPLKCPRRVVIG